MGCLAKLMKRRGDDSAREQTELRSRHSTTPSVPDPTAHTAEAGPDILCQMWIDRTSAPISVPATPTEQPTGIKILFLGTDVKVDIVLLHDVGGHQETTWVSDSGIFWPSRLLPALDARFRLLSHGYDPIRSSQSINEHALDFLVALNQLRTEQGVRNRPLIFVAHGVGGIILKAALIFAASTNTTNLPEYKAIQESTFGILFCGTPHHGMRRVTRCMIGKRSWPRRFGISAKIAISQDLKINSSYLMAQISGFNNISKNIKTVFLYETFKPGRSGELVVPKHSAVVQGARNSTSAGVPSNHFDMVKFETLEDPRFGTIARFIVQMIEDAPYIWY